MRAAYLTAVAFVLGVSVIAASAIFMQGRNAYGTEDRAHQEILQTAITLCGDLMDGGTATDMAVQGRINAELAALARVLAALDVDGTAEINIAEWTNVAQEHLPYDRADTRECRMRIFEGLLARIYPNTQASPGEQTISGSNVVSGSVNTTIDGDCNFPAINNSGNISIDMERCR